MRDGKALQMGTSHELGQNFARAFDIGFLDETGARQLCWTTSWGVSTRMMGGMIMCHGDDAGLRVPPRVAGTQVVVLVVRDDDAGTVSAAARDLVAQLAGSGVRVRLDADVSKAFGRRATDWELKGVPVRIELGPRDLEAGDATVVRRDQSGKSVLPLAELPARVAGLLAEIQTALFEDAAARLRGATADVSSVADAREAAATGFARMPFRAVGESGEDELAEAALTVRCLQTADGGVPTDEHDEDLVAIIGRSY